MAGLVVWVMRHYARVAQFTVGLAVLANLCAYWIAIEITHSEGAADQAASTIYAADLMLVVILFVVPSFVMLWAHTGAHARLLLRRNLNDTVDAALVTARTNAVTTARVDERAIVTAIATLYDQRGLTAPTVVVATSPDDAVALIMEHGNANWDAWTQWLTATVERDVAIATVRGLLPTSARRRIGKNVACVARPVIDLMGTEWQPDAVAMWDASSVATIRFLDSIRMLSPVASTVVRVLSHAPAAFLSDDIAIAVQRPLMVTVNDAFEAHSKDGYPALLWSDGFMVWSWHGTAVPPSVALGTAEPHTVLTIEDPRMRHAAMECLGFDKFIDLLEPVAACADPGNAPHRLELYDLPKDVRRFGQRVLIVTNGTAEMSGEFERFALGVPASIDDPVSAAAWTYNMSRQEYAGALRRA